MSGSDRYWSFGGVPVVRILHVAGDAMLSLESGHVRLPDGLIAGEPAAEFHKARHSALVGTGLQLWWQEQGVERLIVSGSRTEQCCEASAQHRCRPAGPGASACQGVTASRRQHDLPDDVS